MPKANPSPDLAVLVGQRIAQLRAERGLTQEQLAYTTDGPSSKGYLSEVEAGKKLPSIRMLVSIAARLEVESYQLLVFPEKTAEADALERLRATSESRT